MPAERGAAEPGAPEVDDLEPAERPEVRPPEGGQTGHTLEGGQTGQRAIAEHSAPDGPDSGTDEAREPLEKRDSAQEDSRMAAKGTTSIDVEIFGGVYHVRGEQDPEYLRRLAEVVDGKMREISHHVPVVDSGKIAILAALNLADELLQCNNQQEGERVEMMEKVEELTGVLTEALNA